MAVVEPGALTTAHSPGPVVPVISAPGPIRRRLTAAWRKCLALHSMARLRFTISLVGSTVIAAAVLASAFAGPPPGLTPNGRVLWNLDALLNDTFGNRVDCFDGKRYSLFSVARSSTCPAPEARYQTWDFTFLNASHSSFRLVQLTKEPLTGVTNVPVRVGDRYISCPDGEYRHGGPGWLVFGGGAGPTGLFWCN